MSGGGGWPAAPVIYEVNTAVWLAELSRLEGRNLGLGQVPPAAWDAVTPDGVDAVWLMGVWRRSQAGLAVARADPELQRSFREALPDLEPEDVIGSPYCVRSYNVDDRFGGASGLADARRALAERGVRLVLDYVPNHVAGDHPWTAAHPDRFVTGTDEDLAADPSSFVRAAGGEVLALGRDPNFGAWPDVVQLNAFSPAMRQGTVETLRTIGDQCDGVRCDMAMLLMNDVFRRTWGDRAGPEPAGEFWPEVVGRLHETHPDLLLIAEAYWDLEWDLQRQGFDFCYDKRLYDRLLALEPGPVRDHLRAGLDYQSHLLRFLENHDEPRIAGRLAPDPERAAAVVLATLPGATLWHEGQFEGRRVRPPVFLVRRPVEAPDTDLARFHRRLLDVVAAHGVRRGRWRLLEATGWSDNRSCQNLLVWSWSGSDEVCRHVVVVNLSPATASARVPLVSPALAGRSWQLTDLLSGASFGRDGDEMLEPGLYVELAPWACHLLEFV